MPDDEREIDERFDFAIVQPEKEEGAGPTLEEDPRLLDLAKQAAQCMHEIIGVRHDESRNVDISDIKFVVVELTLPLGSELSKDLFSLWTPSNCITDISLPLFFIKVIFQEDNNGCWITKIMPKGNADRNGTVKPGDQLATINGLSAIGMKVDDICAAIADATRKAREVELTFLRYIGPFQPLLSDGENVTSGRPLCNYTKSDGGSLASRILVEGEKPNSTLSIQTPYGISGIAKGHSSQSKRGRRKFRWFGLGKRNTSKTE